MSKLNNSNSVLSTYYLSGTGQSAFIHSFIHSFIKYILSAFRTQGLTLGSRDTAGNSPVGRKSLCSVIMQRWPLFHAVPFFPKKTMPFQPPKRPPLLT